MQEKENILEVLKNTKEAIEKGDYNLLKDLSNQTIHSASIYQDPDSIAIAVVIYSISKILERSNYREYPDWDSFVNNTLLCITHSIQALEKNKEDIFRDEILRIRKQVNTLSENFKKQVQEVFRRAEINKASRIYEHGISMQKTADLLGISIWDLAEYAGETGISEVKLNITLPESQRIKNTLELFEK